MNAIWLIPPPEVASEYSGVIEELSARYGTPRFRPHLTLVSGIESLIDPAPLVPRVRDLEIRPLRIVVGDDYYRCIVVEVAASAELVALRREAEMLCGVAGGEFWPHISLVYGDLGVGEKREIVARLARFPLAPFCAGAIETVAIEGTPEQWRVTTSRVVT